MLYCVNNNRGLSFLSKELYFEHSLKFGLEKLEKWYQGRSSIVVSPSFWCLLCNILLLTKSEFLDFGENSMAASQYVYRYTCATLY